MKTGFLLNASISKASKTSKSTDGKSRKSITLDTKTNEQIHHTKDLKDQADQGDFRMERSLYLDDGGDQGDDHDDGRDGDLRMTEISRDSKKTFNVKFVDGKMICYHDGDQ